MVFLVIVFTPLTILTDSWVDMDVLVEEDLDSLEDTASATTSPALAKASPSISPFSLICSFNFSSTCLSVGERVDDESLAKASPSISPFSLICSFNFSSTCLSVGERVD